MRPGDRIRVGDLELEYQRRPRYGDAHPDDSLMVVDGECDSCAIATRVDTGEPVLLWLCGSVNWSISRHDPHVDRHRTDAYQREAMA